MSKVHNVNTFKGALEQLRKFWWQNNITGFCNKLGIPNDSYAEGQFRALNQICTAMSIILPETLANLIDMNGPVQAPVAEDHQDENMTEVLDFFEKMRDNSGMTDKVRRFAALCFNDVENALTRYRAYLKRKN